jgi:hypothetical protein
MTKTTMTRQSGMTAVRGLALERCASGLALLVCPPAIRRQVDARESTPPVWLVRVLGARLLAQGVVEFTWPTRSVTLTGAVIDATHALSMITAAAWMPRCRRAAAASGMEAGLSALIAASLWRRLP